MEVRRVGHTGAMDFWVVAGGIGIEMAAVEGTLRLAVARDLIYRRAALLACVSLAVFFAGCQIVARLPSDQTLNRIFYAHEGDFEKLVEMSNEDFHLVRIDPDFTRLDADWKWPRTNIGISVERWDEYRQLFQKTELEHGIERSSSPGHALIFFLARSTGTSLAESQKGFVYADDALTLKPILNSLDGDLPPEASVKLGDGTVVRLQAYRIIKDHWYLYRIED